MPIVMSSHAWQLAALQRGLGVIFSFHLSDLGDFENYVNLRPAHNNLVGVIGESSSGRCVPGSSGDVLARAK